MKTIEIESDADIKTRFQAQKFWGLSSCIDLVSCNPDIIRSEEKIRAFVDQLCKHIHMTKFGPCTVIHFGKEERVAGFSMAQLIETSLISGHFANATNAAYLDIFSCSWYPPHETAEFARAYFGAEKVHVIVNFR